MSAARPITGINLSTGAPYSANAWGDGSTDDYNTIQTALNTCGLIHVPSGTYVLSQGLSIPSIDGAGIIGDGGGVINLNTSYAGTTFKASFVSGNIITLPQGITHATLKGFALDRSVSVTSGYGLATNTSNSDDILIDDVWSQKSVTGFYLGTVGYARISNCRAQSNTGHGFEITGQWQTSKLFAQSNGSYGFYVHGTSTAGSSVGQFQGLSTHNNSAGGLWLDGSTNPVHAVRVSDSFFGGDGGPEIYDDSHSNEPNTYANVYCEISRSNLIWILSPVSASLVNCHAQESSGGVGLYAQKPVFIHGGTYNGNHSWGIDTTSTTVIVGTQVNNNGAGGAGGIVISSGQSGAVIGCQTDGNNQANSIPSTVYTAGNF